MRESTDWNLKITFRGLKQCVVIGAIFLLSMQVSTPESMWAIAVLSVVRFTSFCAALAAPFERAFAGACLGLAFFAILMMANLMVHRPHEPIYRDIRHHSSRDRIPLTLADVRPTAEPRSRKIGTESIR